MLAWIFLTAAKLYSLLIFIQTISTYFPSLSEQPLLKKSWNFTRPVLNLIKKQLPAQAGGFDFSPAIAIVLVMIVGKFLAYLFA